MRFRVLGPLEAVGTDGPIPLGGPKQRTVLAHLLMAANHVVSTDQLFDVLWGDDPPATARNTLQTYVSNLRRALGDDRLIHRPPGYLLAVGPGELDAERFESLLHDARKAAAADPRGSLPLLDDALALWRGAALADVADHDTLVAEATRLEELHLAAREERVDALLAAGDAARAASELERLLTEHPLRERLWSGLMLALYRDGRQSDALAAFQRARELLADELGIDPSPELVRRHEQILRQDPALELRGEPLRGYRLLERIGDGRIGTVFRALQPHVGRDVAVKVIHERIASDPDFVRRFDREAQAVAGLEHPHIAPIYDYWREPQAAYVVTRYVAGGSLAAAIERGIDDREAATRIVHQVADALAFAHGRGIAHGEVTAASVLLDPEGNAYLTDFSIGTRDADPDDDVRGLEDLALALLGRRDGEAMRAGAGIATTLDGHLQHERVRNPYKGLRPFTEADAGDFFGRRALVARLVVRLNEDVPGARFLAVIGPSGSGKSSVVRAGLIPAIRGGAVPALDGCVIATMHPGAHPLDELEAALLTVASEAPAYLAPTLQSGPRGLIEAAAALAPDEAEILLVIDQFEEVFTLTRDARERELFLDAVRVAALDPQSCVRMVITLRADLFDRPLAQARFAELLGARNETVPPLTPDELEQVIRLPAERVDVHPEPGLVAAMVSDVARQPGALPLLQYALTELFERRSEDRLTLESYAANGGLAGILSATADRVFERSGDDRRDLVKQIFLRLVTLGEGRLDARRRITRAELTALQVDPAPVDEVLDAFGRSRLLTFDREPATREPTVEIAHEALLSGWSRLRGWIDDGREDLRREHRLVRAAAEWRAAGKDPSFLLTGARLAQLEAWAETTTVLLGVPEREYLVASVQQRAAIREDEERREAKEREVERRSQRRLRGLVAVLTVGALVASALSVVANRERREASRASRLAVARELAASSVANLDVDAERSILLALEAIAVTREHDGTVLPEAEEALHRAVGASRVVRAFPSQGDMIDWSSDGSMFVTEGLDESGLITVRDVETGEPVTPAFTAHDPDVNGVAFSEDSSMLATTGDDGDLRVWDPRTGEAIWGFDGPTGKVWVPSFSPDGSLIAAPFQDQGVVRVWDIERDELVLERRHPEVGFVTSFSPDGRRMAFATWPDESGAIVVDLASGRSVMRLLDGQTIRAVSWSPDGRWIATSGDGGTVGIWDADTGERTGRLYGHRSWIAHSEWAPDSRRIATGSTDGTAKIWEVSPDGGLELLTISAQGSGGWVWPVFSPDGTQVMVGSRSAGLLRIWDVSRSGDAEWANLPVHEFYAGVAFTSDGEAVITGNNDASVTLWDAETGEGLRALGRAGGSPGPGPIRSPVGVVDVSTDGMVAAADWSGEVTVWDEATGDERFVLNPPRRGGVRNLAWSPDGTLLAVVDSEGSTTIVDRTGKEVGVVEERAGFFAHAARFSPDNALLVTAREPTARPNPETVRATIWDWRSGEVVRTLPTWPLDVAFDPTGRTIAAGTMPGGAELYDVGTGRRLATLSGHSGETWNVRFSPDGSLIATAGTDGTIRLWDAASGTLRLTLRGHRSEISGLAFSPDGRKLASASIDGTARVWALDIDDLIGIARDELTRGLTEDECRQYLHRPCEPVRADP